MTTPSLQQTSFPARTKTSSEVINDHLATATSIFFTDKILITLTSAASSGKLSHWVHVPLAPSAGLMDPTFMSTTSASEAGADSSLLPRSDLTATTVLGGTKQGEEVIGQTLATTIASAILMKTPREERMLVLGVGLLGLVEGREDFESVVGLVLGVL